MDNKLKIAISLLLIIVILASILIVNSYFTQPKQDRSFYVGVEYAYADDAGQLKALVDKVATYTNLFVIGSLGISFNRTALDESCSYIVQSGLNFIVLFTGLDKYKNWSDNYQITNWMIDAQQRYGDKFLGIYKKVNEDEIIARTEFVYNSAHLNDFPLNFLKAVSACTVNLLMAMMHCSLNTCVTAWEHS